MGSQNRIGFYSRLPIESGDRVGAIVCIVNPDENAGCSIGPTGSGYHPVMSPVYGTYQSDTGTIEDIEENLSTQVFEEVVRCSFENFCEMLETHSDDYMTYVYTSNIIDDDSSTMKYNVHIIYEHELILQKLSELCPDWLAEQFDSNFTTKTFVWKGNEMTPREIYDMYNDYDEDTDVDITEVKDDIIELVRMMNEAKDYLFMTIEKMNRISLGNCNTSPMDYRILLDNQERFSSSPEFRDEAKKIYRIAKGLGRLGGIFCSSPYGNQSSDWDGLTNMNEIILTFSDRKLSKYNNMYNS